MDRGQYREAKLQFVRIQAPLLTPQHLSIAIPLGLWSLNAWRQGHDETLCDWLQGKLNSLIQVALCDGVFENKDAQSGQKPTHYGWK